MNAPIYQVDAFTGKTFGGNPAAVVPLGRWPEDRVLQHIAAENNLSETAFFLLKGALFEIRWFTPTMEVDLCGHATLATAHVLFEHIHYKKDVIRFNTLYHGELVAFRKNRHIILEFPASPAKQIPAPGVLSEALGKNPAEVYESRDILAVYRTEEEVSALQPDFSLLRSIPNLGVIATAPGTDCDFVSRFFAPNAGIDEDPVTGSAHTTLIPYWANRLEKNELTATQISKRRGELSCQYRDDKVWIGGQAVTYLKGEIFW